MRVTKTRLANLFAALSFELGWSTGPVYVEGKAQIGATFLEHDSIAGWSIGRIMNSGGAKVLSRSRALPAKWTNG